MKAASRSRYFDYLEREGKLPKLEDEQDSILDDEFETDHDDAEAEEPIDEAPRVGMSSGGEIDRSAFVRALKRPRFVTDKP